MRCPYCYNPDIVQSGSARYREEHFLEFISKRRGRLDGVVFSGGECTAYRDLATLCARLKSEGFKVKIDTNGTYPHSVAQLIENDLVDYVALDYKAPRAKFEKVSGSRFFGQFSQTLDLLINSKKDFEVRTTYHSELLLLEDLETMAVDLYQRGYRGTFYIQNFVNAAKTLGSPGESTPLQSTDLLALPVDIEVR